MASTSGLQEIFKKKVSLGPAPQGDIREHVYPVREVSHQGSTPCAVQLLGGTRAASAHGAGQAVPLCQTEKLLLLLLPPVSKGTRILQGGRWGECNSSKGLFSLLSLLLSMGKFLPVHFPKLLHQELQKARWRAETSSDYCQGKQWFKAILSFVEITIYFGFVAPRKRRASFCLHHRICLVLGGRYASVAHRGCTQPRGHCGTFCLLPAPTVTCRVLWGSRCVCGS